MIIVQKHDAYGLSIYGAYLENTVMRWSTTYGKRRAWHQWRSACGENRERYP